MIPQRRYVPEIHDVCPPFAARLPALLDVLPDAARAAVALLVVPNWAGAAALDTDPAFTGRIRAHPGEKVLHGFTHTLGPDWWNWISYGTAQHAEFARLAEAAAADRIARGAAIFERALGVRPHWFCAPRWKQSAGTTRALARAGLRRYMLTDRLVAVDGRTVRLPALQFDEGRRRWRRGIARVLRARRVGRLLESGETFRLVLHPTDPDDPPTWREIGELIDRLQRAGWVPLPLGEALPS